LRGNRDLELSIYIRFSVEESPSGNRRVWRTELQGYEYLLQRGNGHEILAYHWHPIGRSYITEPHLHVSGSIAGIDLSKAHLPTAAVSLSRFIQFLISDLGVEPIRADWQRVLSEPLQPLDPRHH